MDDEVVEVAVPDIDLDQTKLIRGEAAILMGYLLPIAGTHFLEYSLLVVTVVSVGHIGTTELAAASLASMTSNVVALSVINGFCTAVSNTPLPLASSITLNWTVLTALSRPSSPRSSTRCARKPSPRARRTRRCTRSGRSTS